MKRDGGLFLIDRLHNSGGDECPFDSEVRLYGLCMGRIYGIWCSYAALFILSVRKKYPIRYDLKSIGCYVLLAAILYVIAEYVPIGNIYLRMAFRTLLLSLFVAYIIKRDLPLSQIPVINRFIRK